MNLVREEEAEIPYHAATNTTFEPEVKPTIFSNAKFFFKQGIAGIRDALHVVNFYRVFSSSHQVRSKLFNIVVFNGLVSLGTLAVFQYAVLPTVHFLFESYPIESTTVRDLANAYQYFIIGLYYILWAIPIFLLSFLMNAAWLDVIAERAFVLLRKQPRPSGISNISHISKDIASQVYALTFCMMFVGQTSLCYLVPVIGPLLNILFLCWLYSLYCFEYRWTNWHVGRRLKYIEDNWAYFVGFGLMVGLPFTVASFYCGFWISYAVWFLEFPFFIITAIGAGNPPNTVDVKGNTRMALFKTAKWLNTKLLSVVVWIFVGGTGSRT
eukprot:TRINITY_DN6785_c0_g1_i1.p1 TRINITY_DN6785_c0_g1~~TRINITY_DN6785_c0_g1_i1.p1  ORF type:complete len:325 (-),score=38.65 TRINITY_DN6785_c0_g1_i1:52-1026(-)